VSQAGREEGVSFSFVKKTGMGSWVRKGLLCKREDDCALRFTVLDAGVRSPLVEFLYFNGDGVMISAWVETACFSVRVQENLGILDGETCSFTGEREGRCLVREEGGFGGNGFCSLLGLDVMLSPAKAVTKEGWQFLSVLTLGSPCCEGELDETVEVLQDLSWPGLVLSKALLSILLLLHVEDDKA
jgi:hypothetical protein